MCLRDVRLLEQAAAPSHLLNQLVPRRVMHLHMESDDSEHVTRSAVAESAISWLGPLLPPGGVRFCRAHNGADRGARAEGGGKAGAAGGGSKPPQLFSRYFNVWDYKLM